MLHENLDCSTSMPHNDYVQKTVNPAFKSYVQLNFKRIIINNKVPYLQSRILQSVYNGE